LRASMKMLGECLLGDSEWTIAMHLPFKTQSWHLLKPKTSRM
jgi:hypothetical protein